MTEKKIAYEYYTPWTVEQIYIKLCNISTEQHNNFSVHI